MDKETEEKIRYNILVAFRATFQDALGIGKTTLQETYKDLLLDKLSEERADTLFGYLKQYFE